MTFTRKGLLTSLLLSGRMALCGLSGSDIPHAAVARAVVPVTTHEFGTVRQGEKVTATFPIRNNGSAPLTVELLELSQPGMRAGFAREIAAGAESKIILEWTTTHVKREVTGEALVRLNDPKRENIKFALTGTVRPPIDVLPFAAVFLSAFRGEETERTLRIVNNEERPLSVLGVESNSSRFQAAVRVVEPGRLFDLTAKIKPDAPFGRIQERLYVLTDDPARPRVPVVVNALIKPDVYANPESLDFGEISREQLARAPSLVNLLGQTFLVRKRAGQFAITSITCDLPAVHLKQVPPDRSGSFRVDVALDRSQLQPGELRGAIHIRTDDPNFTELELPVRGMVK